MLDVDGDGRLRLQDVRHIGRRLEQVPPKPLTLPPRPHTLPPRPSRMSVISGAG